MKSNTVSKLEAYNFELDEGSIARFPSNRRSDSRLLLLQKNKLFDYQITDLPDLLQPGDRLVVNDTKVMKARIFTQRATGGGIEIFITKILRLDRCLARIRPSKRIKEGEIFILDSNHHILCRSREGDSWILEGSTSIQKIMNLFGEIPIPPYFKRRATKEDEERYQSIFANELGAVAASTASLHLSNQLITLLEQKEIAVSSITLHIGMGTFAPLRAEQLKTKT